MRTRRLLFIAGLIVALIANACYESQQGCLDVRAVNYYAGADENCCCRYPKLILSSDQVYDTLLFRLDSLYPADNGQLFRIKNIVFYISDVELEGPVKQCAPAIHCSSGFTMPPGMIP